MVSLVSYSKLDGNYLHGGVIYLYVEKKTRFDSFKEGTFHTLSVKTMKLNSALRHAYQLCGSSFNTSLEQQIVTILLGSSALFMLE